MVPDKFHITIHMVSSVDGMIAKPDNSIGWFETSHPYEKGVEAEDPVSFLEKIDCYVMGANTYELAVELSEQYGWAYGDKPTIVLTHRTLASDRPNIRFHAGDLPQFVKELLQANYNNVWVVGGASLVRDFLRLKLADEIRLTVLPIILGEGLPFFDHIGMEQVLELKDSKAYRNGMVELCYAIRK